VFQVKDIKLHDLDLNTDKRNVYKFLVVNPEIKIPLEKPRPRWEDNIKMDLTEVRCKVVNWSHLAQDRDQWRARVNTAMNFWVA
jgi:hypothetical protein